MDSNGANALKYVLVFNKLVLSAVNEKSLTACFVFIVLLGSLLLKNYPPHDYIAYGVSSAKGTDNTKIMFL